MTRSTVLIASIEPVMAYSLGEKLRPRCRELGLRLAVCPDADGDEALETRGYASAEALFDVLEKMDPMELADTLVVLDIGASLEDAFAPAAQTGSDWRPSRQVKAGVAVELLLRFPQVFPVFLSPAVPLTEPVDSSDRVITPCCPEAYEENLWSGFQRLREELCIGNRSASDEKEVLDLSKLPALQVPLHFVSPLDSGKGLLSTLGRFARGMRCWFDPTGLRTLVKNRFLGTSFGNQNGWSNTWPKGNEPGPTLRKTLLERLTRTAVAVDEEREFATFNAYAAYKHGYRVWLVTSFGELAEKPLWNLKSETEGMTIIRDIDLRFPDYPTRSGGSGEGIREHLKNINSSEWQNLLPKERKNLQLAVVSSVAGPKIKNSLQKPVSSLYEIKRLLEYGKPRDSLRSISARIGKARDQEHGTGHGAPYFNLPMAESLLRQASRLKDSSMANLLAALLANEVNELLLGMSTTTVLEALLLQHSREVTAEVEFPGVAYKISIQKRKLDVYETLVSIFEPGPSTRDAKNKFLSQFWAKMRLLYKDGEQFHAAEESNIESMIYSEWTPERIPESIRKFDPIRLKRFLVCIATSLLCWFLVSVFILFSFTGVYAWILGYHCQLDGTGLVIFFNLFYEVFITSLSLGPSSVIQTVSKSGDFAWIAVALHTSIAYILFGLFVSMFYRKVTRG